MLTPWEFDRKIEAAELEKRKKRTGHTTHIVIENLNKPSHPPTRIDPDPLPEDDDDDQPAPHHSEAAARNEALAERRRERVQHQTEPFPAEAPEVAQADLGKRFTQAHDTPSGYPVMGPVGAEALRRGPITGGEAAYGPGYAGFAADACPVPVPSAALSAASISRPLITEGQSRPCAPDGR